MATSLSELVPPVRTVIFIGSSELRSAKRRGQGAGPLRSSLLALRSSSRPYQLLQKVVSRHNPNQLPVLLHQCRRVFAGEHRRQPVGGKAASTTGKAASITSRTGRSSTVGWAQGRGHRLPPMSP